MEVLYVKKSVFILIFFTIVFLLSFFVVMYGYKFEPKIYPIPSDFVVIPYRAEKGKYLGRRSTKDYDVLLSSVHEIKGLSKNEYILFSEGSIYASSTLKVFMQKDIQEPILRYKDSVFKIEIDVNQKNEDGAVVKNLKNSVEDNQVILDFITLYENGKTVDWDDNTYISDTQNIFFYFDLPCKLIWESTLYFHDDGEIYWLCWDFINNKKICYNVTNILPT